MDIIKAKLYKQINQNSSKIRMFKIKYNLFTINNILDRL